MSRILALCCLAATLYGCATTEYAEQVPFTDQLADEFQLDQADRRRLQYFLAHDIHLVRAMSSGQQGIDDGKLVSRSGQRLHEVIVPRGVGGVVLASGEDWMAVSFERGSYLYFTSRPQFRGTLTGEDPADGRYFLYAPDWNGQGAGTVVLRDQTYQAVDDSYRAYLLVDRESLSSVERSQDILPGRFLGER